MSEYSYEVTFEKNDFTSNPLPKGEYENCQFVGCNFSEANLSDYKFIECTFKECNLSLAKLNKTSFRDAVFMNCKMLGLRWDACNTLGLSFTMEDCQLNHSSFFKLNLKKTVFKNCQIQEVDFAEADLTQAVWENCDLLNAAFGRTVLEKADFRTSYNFRIDPENNRLKKAKFSIEGVRGLLDKYDLDIV